jgi:hypothetical protein
MRKSAASVAGRSFFESASSSSSSSSRAASTGTTDALLRLFGWLESRFGGLPFDSGPAAQVITRNAATDNSSSSGISSSGLLLAADLQRLMRHEATALHVKGFYNKDAARLWGQQLTREVHQPGKGARNWKVSTSRGLESSDVWTLGEHAPYNIAVANSSSAKDNDDGVSSTREETKHASSSPIAAKKSMDDYFDGVLREFQQRRQPQSLFASNINNNNKTAVIPPLWPLDLFRLSLDEAWPSGASLARDEGRPMSGGLPRVMKGPTRWKRGFVHVDEMAPLHIERGLFSANIYLQLPDNDDENNNNGEKAKKKYDSNDDNGQDVLEIWPLGIRSRWDWYRNALLLSGLSSQDAAAQIRLRHALGQPIKIAVEPGDLVLLCVQRPHAAIGFSSPHTVRVSLQCFVQHHGSNKPLLIDS